jgi:hypothetical protein
LALIAAGVITASSVPIAFAAGPPSTPGKSPIEIEFLQRDDVTFLQISLPNGKRIIREVGEKK